MSICYGVARWSYGGDTVHTGRTTVIPRNRFNTVYTDSMRCLPVSLRCGPGVPRCPHRSAAGTENQESVNEALAGVRLSVRQKGTVSRYGV